jgi:hypothetical protein
MLPLTGLLLFIAGVLVTAVAVLGPQLLQSARQRRPARETSCMSGVLSPANQTTVAAYRQSLGDVLDRRRL